jgi:Flp pilus assembly protein protease CpaA
VNELVATLWTIPCAVQDWRYGEVSNWLTVPVFLLAVGLGAWQALHGYPLFFAVLLVVLLAWRLGWVGAADGKIVASLSAISPVALACGLAVLGAWFNWERLKGRKDARLPGAVGFALGAAIATVVTIAGAVGG